MFSSELRSRFERLHRREESMGIKKIRSGRRFRSTAGACVRRLGLAVAMAVAMLSLTPGSSEAGWFKRLTNLNGFHRFVDRATNPRGFNRWWGRATNPSDLERLFKRVCPSYRPCKVSVQFGGPSGRK